jgi:hypothetical protein
MEAISCTKIHGLHGSRPIAVKSGECSSEEIKIGTVGVGKVVGKLTEWTDSTVKAVRKNLSARSDHLPGLPRR